MTIPILLWDQAYNRNGDAKLPRAVVNVIRTYMDNHTLAGWVSQETLARDTGMTVRGVRKQIDANVRAGWLEVVRRGCTGKSSDYRLTYPTIGTTVPVAEGDDYRNHSSGSELLGEPQFRLLPEPQFPPTTPRTSPQEKFFNETPTGSLAVEVEHATEDEGATEAPDVWDRRMAFTGGAPLGDPFS